MTYPDWCGNRLLYCTIFVTSSELLGKAMEKGRERYRWGMNIHLTWSSVCLSVLSWSVIRTKDLRRQPQVVTMRFGIWTTKPPTVRNLGISMGSKIWDKSVTYHGSWVSKCAESQSHIFSKHFFCQQLTASHFTSNNSHRVIWGLCRHCRPLGATAALAVPWIESSGSSENNNEGSFSAC